MKGIVAAAYGSIVLIVAGGILLYGGVSRIRKYRRILKDDVRTMGVVTRMEQSGEDYSFFIVFTDEQGVQRECKMWSSPEASFIDQQVPLIYYRPDPDLVIVNPSRETFVVPWFFVLGGLSLLISVPVLLYLAFVRRLFNEDKEDFQPDLEIQRARAAELQFRIACKNAMADGKITVNENQKLNMLAEYFKISNQAAKEMFKDELKIFRQDRKDS
ncbi:MAG: DUF3592 domain-containing protein [Planctomycetota bacterium]|jgi:hypothetical protein